MSEKIAIIGTFDNANVKKDGIAAMRFKFPFTEIANWSKLLLFVGSAMKILAVTDNNEKIKLGKVYFKSLSIDKEGEAKLTVEGEANIMDMSKAYMMVEQCVKVYVKPVSDEEEASNE